MATKKKAPKAAEEPKEEVVEEVVEAPKEEVKKAAPKALKADLSKLPDPDLSPLPLKEFITESYAAMLGREPLDLEMEHHIKTVERHKRPRSDIHIDIRKGGEYQGLHALNGEGSLLGGRV
jgi:hypothetical protein